MRLLVHEWLAILTLGGAIVSASIISHFHHSPECPQELSFAPTIEVIVKGAVKETITLEVTPGAVLSDVFEKIPFEESADRPKVANRRLMRDGQVVIIPKKKMKGLR